MTEMTIEKMALCHIRAIIEIERSCFSDPWSEEMFLSELSNKNAAYFVCISDGEVAGYIGYCFAADEADITNVAVKPSKRRMGIGSQLMEYALLSAYEQGIRFMALEVRVSNKKAISLYEKYGFIKAGIRKRYYSDNGEDAHIMTKEW